MSAFKAWCRSIQPRWWRAPRPPAPQGVFIPRATRRRGVVGAHRDWRIIWYATRGYPALMQDLAAKARQRA